MLKETALKLGSKQEIVDFALFHNISGPAAPIKDTCRWQCVDMDGNDICMLDTCSRYPAPEQARLC